MFLNFHLQGDQLKHGRVFLVLFPVYACTVAYTGQVTFYKVPEKHGHVYLVGLYMYKTRHFLKITERVFTTILGCPD